MDTNEMRKKYEEAIKRMMASKRQDNKAFMTIAEYNKRIKTVKEAKKKFRTSGNIRTTKDYRLIRKYDVFSSNGIERLIKPVDDKKQNMLYYITIDEMFDIIHTTHMSLNHGGRNKMMIEIKSNYTNITNEAVMVYLRLCEQCQKKTLSEQCQKKLNLAKKGVLSKAVLHFSSNSRAQVDIIDMQSQPYNDFCFILVHQDCLTRFTILKPLKSNNPTEIAHNLLEIYTTFGAPAILHSNNGKEFVTSILKELHEMWSSIKIVYGNPFHTQSQNKDITDLLSTWMEDNKSKDWTMGLKIVQFEKNRAVQEVSIYKSPYEAMFGCQARIGLLSVGVPQNEIPNINCEEDIESMMQDQVEDPDETNSNDSSNLNDQE